MGKVHIPEKHRFFSKIFGAFFILISMILLGSFAIMDSSPSYSEAFYKSFSVITKADLDPDQDNKFFPGSIISYSAAPSYNIMIFQTIYFLHFLCTSKISINLAFQ